MPAIAMALRKQRIYTRYKPEPAKTPQRRSDWKALLLLLFVVMGVAWWAAVQGKLVLPSALQQFVQVARQPAADPKTEIEAPAPKPISGFDFGTLPVPPPPLNTTLPAPLPPPAAVEEVPIPPSFEIEQPAPPAKSAYEAVCARVLRDVREGIPESAGYRKVVEATYEDRLAKAKACASVEEIERAIGEGQIEELYEIAKDELALIPKMRAWKPWEFDHEIEVIEEPKENPYKEALAKED